MTDAIHLDPSEILSDRPFTHPERNTEDAAVLRRMARTLRRVLGERERAPDHPRPLILDLQETDGRRERVVISNLEELLAASEITVVGFFGTKRPEVDREEIDALDRALVGEFYYHPGVLSYSSIELDNGDWVNLVLLRDPEAKERWKLSAKHVYASNTKSPDYYLHVRLQNGAFHGGLVAGGDLVLVRTKYYDYQGEGTWRAIRESPAA